MRSASAETSEEGPRDGDQEDSPEPHLPTVRGLALDLGIRVVDEGVQVSKSPSAKAASFSPTSSMPGIATMIPPGRLLKRNATTNVGVSASSARKHRLESAAAMAPQKHKKRAPHSAKQRRDKQPPVGGFHVAPENDLHLSVGDLGTEEPRKLDSSREWSGTGAGAHERIAKPVQQKGRRSKRGQYGQKLSSLQMLQAPKRGGRPSSRQSSAEAESAERKSSAAAGRAPAAREGRFRARGGHTAQ